MKIMHWLRWARGIWDEYKIGPTTNIKHFCNKASFLLPTSTSLANCFMHACLKWISTLFFTRLLTVIATIWVLFLESELSLWEAGWCLKQHKATNDNLLHDKASFCIYRNNRIFECYLVSFSFASRFLHLHCNLKNKASNGRILNLKYICLW